MFSVSKLTDDQKAQISSWVEGGDQLADIQKKMESELGIAVTYMDTRFLILDLNLEIKKEEEPVEIVEETPVRVATGEVSLTIDELVRPGMMISGRVTFSDGEPALWGLDEAGRLSLDADTASYQPSEQDLASFQTILRQKLEAMR